MLKRWWGGKRRNLKCAAVTPVGPGHVERARECRASIETAWRHGQGPFSELEFCFVDDSRGELGRSKARNIGVEAARRANADWIFFLDADDLMTLRAFEIFAEYADRFDAVWGLMAIKPPAEAEHHIRFPQALTLRSVDELLLLDPFVTLLMGHFVRTDMAASLPFNETMNAGEDFDYYIRAWSKFRCTKLAETLSVNRADRHSTGPRSATADQWRVAATARLAEGIKAHGLERDSPRAIEALNRVSKEAQAFSRARSEASPDALKMFASRLPYHGMVDITGCAGGDGVLFCDNDDPVALSLGWIGEYQPASSRLWQLLCAKAELVLDVDAGTGYYAVLAAKANPGAAVICCEPDVTNFARLQSNLAANEVRKATASRAHTAATDALGARNAGGAPIAVRFGRANSAARAIAEMAPMLARSTPDLLVAAPNPDDVLRIEGDLGRYGYRFYTIDETAETIVAGAGLEPAAGPSSANRWATTRSASDAHTLIKAAYCDLDET